MLEIKRPPSVVSFTQTEIDSLSPTSPVPVGKVTLLSALLEPSIDALAASGLGSKSATMAIGERLLRVELHLDIIRGLIRHADGREAVEEEGGF